MFVIYHLTINEKKKNVLEAKKFIAADCKSGTTLKLKK